MEQLFEIQFLSNSVVDYLLAIAVLVFGLLAVRVFRSLVVRRLRRWSTYSSTELDDIFIRLVERFAVPLAQLGVVYLSVTGLTLHPILQQSVNVISVLLLTLILIQCTGKIVEQSIHLYAVRRGANSPHLEESLSAVSPAIKIVFWIIGIIFLLDNFGFDISAIVASLGIGGIAIALASQGVLQDLFSYFSIIFDRPFEIGDFIVVDDFVGTVQHVGIKTTRLQSLSGEELVIANTDLTGARLRNYRKMQERRISFQLGVTYETGLDQLEAIPSLIQDIVEQIEAVRFDRAHFASYGDFSLNFEVVYFVNTGDYSVYMDAQQAINFALKQEFEQRNIEFAYPTQVTYLSGDSGSKEYSDRSELTYSNPN